MKLSNARTVSDRSGKKFTFQRGRTLFAVVALGLALVIAFVLRMRAWIMSSSTKPVETPLVITQQEASARLVALVATHLQLPSEAPAVERVTDIETLRAINPAFYVDLAEGDWILRYRAQIVVYRASQDRVIRVVQLVQPSATQPTP